ncbi:MAG: hypothetical protein NTY12_02595 [Candidatus Falkowbacteria bacterium]|nr:hypothetical protein [Candidatus Falkowbacteria bacterium]
MKEALETTPSLVTSEIIGGRLKQAYREQDIIESALTADDKKYMDNKFYQEKTDTKTEAGKKRMEEITKILASLEGVVNHALIKQHKDTCIKTSKLTKELEEAEARELKMEKDDYIENVFNPLLENIKTIIEKDYSELADLEKPIEKLKEQFNMSEEAALEQIPESDRLAINKKAYKIEQLEALLREVTEHQEKINTNLSFAKRKIEEAQKHYQDYLK